MEEKILTLHPEGKNGVNINKAKYDTIRNSMLEALQKGNPSYKEMVAHIKEKLKGQFDGSVSGYIETAKLYLEIRNLIQRIENRPHRYVLTKRLPEFLKLRRPPRGSLYLLLYLYFRHSLHLGFF